MSILKNAITLKKCNYYCSYSFFIILGFVTIGTLFDVGVWYFVKDVKIFDEEIELEDIAEEPGETH